MRPAAFTRKSFDFAFLTDGVGSPRRIRIRLPRRRVNRRERERQTPRGTPPQPAEREADGEWHPPASRRRDAPCARCTRCTGCTVVQIGDADSSPSLQECSVHTRADPFWPGPNATQWHAMAHNAMQCHTTPRPSPSRPFPAQNETIGKIRSVI